MVSGGRKSLIGVISSVLSSKTAKFLYIPFSVGLGISLLSASETASSNGINKINSNIVDNAKITNIQSSEFPAPLQNGESSELMPAFGSNTNSTISTVSSNSAEKDYQNFVKSETKSVLTNDSLKKAVATNNSQSTNNSQKTEQTQEQKNKWQSINVPSQLENAYSSIKKNTETSEYKVVIKQNNQESILKPGTTMHNGLETILSGGSLTQKQKEWKLIEVPANLQQAYTSIKQDPETSNYNVTLKHNGRDMLVRKGTTTHETIQKLILESASQSVSGLSDDVWAEYIVPDNLKPAYSAIKKNNETSHYQVTPVKTGQSILVRKGTTTHSTLEKMLANAKIKERTKQKTDDFSEEDISEPSKTYTSKLRIVDGKILVPSYMEFKKVSETNKKGTVVEKIKYQETSYKREDIVQMFKRDGIDTYILSAYEELVGKDDGRVSDNWISFSDPNTKTKILIRTYINGKKLSGRGAIEIKGNDNSYTAILYKINKNNTIDMTVMGAVNGRRTDEIVMKNVHSSMVKKYMQIMKEHGI